VTAFVVFCELAGCLIVCVCLILQLLQNARNEILPMDSSEQVFKWGSFYPDGKIPKEEYRHSKRDRSSSSASQETSTGPSYLAIDATTGQIIEGSVDIMTASSSSTNGSQSHSAAAEVDAKLMWWGIRPEPLLTQEVCDGCICIALVTVYKYDVMMTLWQIEKRIAERLREEEERKQRELLERQRQDEMERERLRLAEAQRVQREKELKELQEREQRQRELEAAKQQQLERERERQRALEKEREQRNSRDDRDRDNRARDSKDANRNQSSYYGSGSSSSQTQGTSVGGPNRVVKGPSDRQWVAVDPHQQQAPVLNQPSSARPTSSSVASASVSSTDSYDARINSIVNKTVTGRKDYEQQLPPPSSRPGQAVLPPQFLQRQPQSSQSQSQQRSGNNGSNSRDEFDRSYFDDNNKKRKYSNDDSPRDQRGNGDPSRKDKEKDRSVDALSSPKSKHGKHHKNRHGDEGNNQKKHGNNNSNSSDHERSRKDSRDDRDYEDYDRFAPTSRSHWSSSTDSRDMYRDSYPQQSSSSSSSNNSSRNTVVKPISKAVAVIPSSQQYRSRDSYEDDRDRSYGDRERDRTRDRDLDRRDRDRSRDRDKGWDSSVRRYSDDINDRWHASGR
jgi:hypothetical protein